MAPIEKRKVTIDPDVWDLLSQIVFDKFGNERSSYSRAANFYLREILKQHLGLSRPRAEPYHPPQPQQMYDLPAPQYQSEEFEPIPAAPAPSKGRSILKSIKLGG